MIDDELLDILVHPNPEVRKGGVKRLAQMKSREVLPYLAEIVRDDEDAEVRDLARKAGQYIQKNAPASTQHSAPPPPSSSSSSSLYADDDDYDDEEPYGSTSLYDEPDDNASATTSFSDAYEDDYDISEGAAERAKGLVQSALDFNMRRDNDRAVKALTQAVRLDPRLLKDQYTIGLAGDIMRMDGEAGLQSLAPSKAELDKMRYGAQSSSQTSGAHRFMGFSMMMSAVVVLVSFLLFPWIDLSPVETVDDNNQPTTLGAIFDQLDSQLDDETIAGLRLLGGEEVNDLIDAVQGLSIEFTGLDTTLLSMGQLDFFDAMGFRDLMNATVGSFGDLAGISAADVEELNEIEFKHDPDPLDNLLIFVPISAVLVTLLGIVLIATDRIIIWVLAFILGAGGIGALLYFYFTGIDNLFSTDTFSESLEGFNETATQTTTEFASADLIATGFWVAVVGMGLIVLFPFLAIVTMPNADEA